ncbi:uncharacterized protein FFB20_09143 [Fusarium fujikuroi]|uniref:Uncharacterized protein n=1 Tax=Fusarium fujikuroi TaxID=5127 RepID=A0A2H3SY28_FUSFU|nr:uncharacterized protein FFB20_09143 [Fusarium fujikuroi]SCO24077.1 uncharacterized protein FFE2_15868 [Fusarium fujikuroi]SCO25661.1 uncharacterized protein FFC1_15645 [Fusarium fujikuroi]SCO26838.1 uncharacterized protein FFM5_15107 [Fusarium fujikuroi]SCO53913.1 uncharacterized protein FFNC_15253 [Fusarium fujikuroi]
MLSFKSHRILTIYYGCLGQLAVTRDIKLHLYLTQTAFAPSACNLNSAEECFIETAPSREGQTISHYILKYNLTLDQVKTSIKAIKNYNKIFAGYKCKKNKA